MHLRLNLLTKIFIGILFFTGFAFIAPSEVITPKVDAALACCYGSPIDGTASCKDSSTCGSNQCAYVSSCFLCDEANYGNGSCEPSRHGIIVSNDKGCRAKTACQNGTYTCGSCTEDPPAGGTPPAPPPGCYWPGGLQFGTANLRKPADGATGLDPAVIQFEWQRVIPSSNVYAGQDWGHVNNPCTLQARIYTIYIREALADGTCTGARSTFSPIDVLEYPATNGGNEASGGADPLIVKNVWKNNMLKYATSYCWFVKKENKVGAALYSERRKFTTDARPVWVSSRIINARNNAQVPTCGADIRRVGKYSAASTTIQNPMDIEVTYRDPDSTGDFTDLMVALVPRYDTSGETLRITESSMRSKIVNDRSLAMRFGINNTLTVKNLSTLNLAATFTPDAVAGDLNNNIDANATILSMGSATNITITTNADLSRTIVAKFRVRFNDNFPNNTSDPANLFYNIYTTLFFSRTRTNINNGNIITTSYSADFDQTTMTGFKNYLRTFDAWFIDTTPPTPTLTSTLNADNSFNVVWRAADNVGLEANTGFKTSVHANVAGDSLMQDYPGGTIINPVPTSEPGSSNLNAYLNLSNGVNHTEVYRDQNGGVLSNSTFTLDIDDLACNNGRFQITVAGLPSPWLSVFNGNISVGGALTGATIPPVSPYTQRFSLEDTADSTQPYTTAYAFIAGGTTLPSTYISKKNLYANSYNDLSDAPPEGTSWYQYFLAKVQDSSTPVTTLGTTNITNPGASTTTQDISVPLSQTSGVERNFIINGNLTINPRNNCNLRSIFVISGNLTIHSDFQIREHATSGIFNACLFVVLGNVEMYNNVPNASRFKYSAAGEEDTYGLFEANIFADGNITIFRVGATPLGTFVSGNLTAIGQITSNSNFSGATNLTKPSLLVYTDPRYIITFMDELGKYSYSIREEGFIP
jgi:hypothetical protein